MITTDLHSPAEQVVARYADRWSIEQTIKDGKDLLGVGDAQNRVKTAVERTAPFMFLTLTILICWYARAGDTAADLATRRSVARWILAFAVLLALGVLGTFPTFFDLFAD